MATVGASFEEEAKEDQVRGRVTSASSCRSQQLLVPVVILRVVGAVGQSLKTQPPDPGGGEGEGDGEGGEGGAPPPGGRNGPGGPRGCLRVLQPQPAAAVARRQRRREKAGDGHGDQSP
jgi:hypothetical protein